MTRVVERSMTRRLKSSKLRHPLLPASATVVTQLRSVNPSGITLRSPPEYDGAPLAWIHVDVDVDEPGRDVEP